LTGIWWQFEAFLEVGYALFEAVSGPGTDQLKQIWGRNIVILRYVIAWIPMVFIAIANGAFRQLGYGKFLGELFAHQLSCLTGILLFLSYTWCLSLYWPLESSRQAFTIGLIWLALTIAFEFLFMHFGARVPWDKLLHDYNIFEGRLWVLVLISVLLLPYGVFRLRS
jgi:hypothetical protein